MKPYFFPTSISRSFFSSSISRFLQYLSPRNRTVKMAQGMVMRNRGPSKPI